MKLSYGPTDDHVVLVKPIPSKSNDTVRVYDDLYKSCLQTLICHLIKNADKAYTLNNLGKRILQK